MWYHNTRKAPINNLRHQQTPSTSKLYTHNRENITNSPPTTTTNDWHTTTVSASSKQPAPLIRASYLYSSTDESRSSSALFASCVQWTRIVWSDTNKITNWPQTMSHRYVGIHDNANCRASRRECTAWMSKNGLLTRRERAITYNTWVPYIFSDNMSSFLAKILYVGSGIYFLFVEMFVFWLFITSSSFCVF